MAIRIVAAAIAQASATGSQGGVDDIRGIQDMSAGTKRKEDSSSSNPGKKHKTSILHESQGQGQGHQDQGQDEAVSQAGQIICYFYRQPGHFRRDYPRRQVTCYHCRQSGHMRQDCPRRQRSHGTAN